MKDRLVEAATQSPVIGVFGSRQSGKTTLVREVFKEYHYFSLESPEIFEAIKSNPRAFIEEHKNSHGIIFDEFQHFPQLLSYIQLYVDEHQRPGYFVLTGSQNFLMNQAITQSLAGRIALFTLLPLSLAELKLSGKEPETISMALFKGCYPRMYMTDADPFRFYNDYIATYVERDVRVLQNVVNLSDFKRFMGLCAGRTGQLLNIASLASDCGIDQRTAKEWLSVLEASYIIYLMPPYFRNNFGKRLMKTPKLYFYDTGLACALLGIKAAEELSTHYLRGGLFESLMITELAKHFYNDRYTPPLYFWRDHHGNEIDCLVEMSGKVVPIEIKVGSALAGRAYAGFDYWRDIAGDQAANGFVIYGGLESFPHHEDRVIGWQSVDKIFK